MTPRWHIKIRPFTAAFRPKLGRPGRVIGIQYAIFDGEILVTHQPTIPLAMRVVAALERGRLTAE